jgi:hypothetical protein
MVKCVPDEYSQPDYADDHVNVDCALSWRMRTGNVEIDFRNGWFFDSHNWKHRKGARELVLAALKGNVAGKARC